MNDNRIFVTNFAGHDLLPAFKFSTLPKEKAQVNITEGNVDVFDVNRLIYIIKQRIGQSKKDDYLLLSGSVVINCIAFSLWLGKHGTVNLLIYNPKGKYYSLRKIDHRQIFTQIGKQVL